MPKKNGQDELYISSVIGREPQLGDQPMEDRRRPAREEARRNLLRAAELWFWTRSQEHWHGGWDLINEWHQLKPFVKIRRFMEEVRASEPIAVRFYEATDQSGADMDVALYNAVGKKERGVTAAAKNAHA